MLFYPKQSVMLFFVVDIFSNSWIIWQPWHLLHIGTGGHIVTISAAQWCWGSFKQSPTIEYSNITYRFWWWSTRWSTCIFNTDYHV